MAKTVAELLDLPVEMFASELLKRNVTATAEDAPLIAQRFVAILTKCTECVERFHTVALRGYLSLLTDAMSENEEPFIAAFCDDTPVVKIQQLFEDVTLNLRCGSDASKDLLDALVYIIDSPRTKDRCGMFLVAGLLAVLAEGYSPQAPEGKQNRSYVHQRLAASHLISLMRGSTGNKTLLIQAEVNLGSSVGTVSGLAALCKAVGETSDFLLQMQCTELLFRAHVFNRHALSALSAPWVPSSFVAAVQSIRNDASMLRGISAALEDLNESAEPRKIYAFEVLSVEFGPSSHSKSAHGSVTLCGQNTSVHFSSRFLLIMMPQLNGENIVVEYQDIQSVRLGKDQRLGLRISPIPPLLEAAIVDAGGEPSGNDFLYMKLTASTLLALRDSPIQGWIAEQKHLGKKSHASPPQPKGKNPSPAKRMREEESLILANPIVERSPNARRPTGMTPKQGRTRPPPPAAANSTSLPQLNSLLRDALDAEVPLGATTSVDEMLSALKGAIRDKVSKQRHVSVEFLNETVHTIQAEIDSFREANRQERDAYEEHIRSELNGFRAAEQDSQGRVSMLVAGLNKGLQELQSIGQVIKDQTSAIEVELDGAVSRSVKKEEEMLVALKGRLEGELMQMERSMDDFISAANPLRFLVSYLNRKMAES